MPAQLTSLSMMMTGSNIDIEIDLAFLNLNLVVNQIKEFMLSQFLE